MRLQALGRHWVAFSALSGETHQINDEAAALLEWLAAGPMSEAALAAALATATDVDEATIRGTLRGIWPSLESAGLVRTAPGDDAG